LEAELALYCSPERWEMLLRTLGEDDLAAANGVSRVSYGGAVEKAPAEAFPAEAGAGLRIAGRAMEAAKCQRCWRRQPSVGQDAGHPQLCGRCVEYLTG